MEDRISELPEVVLLHILSFLPMCQVVRTSILSRRWRHLWTQVPVLDFGTHEPEFSLWSIESFINYCLMLYNAPKIKKFCARVDQSRICHCTLDAWLRFAVQHNVEELDMDYIAGYHSGNLHFFLYNLMPGLFSQCGELRALRLRGCALNLLPSLCLGSLRTLKLYHVIIVSDLNTSGFPLLESLTLYGCNSRKHLSIYSPNHKLEKLKICDVSDVLYASGDLIIDAPYLSSIEISGYMRHSGYSIKNLSSVTHACLNFTGMFRTAYTLFGDHMSVKLLESLSHVKTLKLCQWSIQNMALMGKPILENSVFSTTCLELGASLNRCEIKGIAHLLINSHYLATLAVDIQMMVGRNYDIAESEGWEMLELAMSSLLHLKTVQIYNLFRTTEVSFYGEASHIINKVLTDCEKEITLLEVVLKSCKMLDKMFISAINTQDPTEWMLISELLLKLTEVTFKFIEACLSFYLLATHSDERVMIAVLNVNLDDIF
ncbi:F-box/LRR-repeat protein At3g26922-like [Phoenix dactylifera]|uniref:F-box/LRR-repeat protein At3g26922-like n=1 Tax=Phoenix dactylifera TaxID=42345 RepID=A0A8B7CJ21_PHODC|nr:F-box/LRR-repeat protein At3g26922-like [Phoenix dactylifera]